MNDCCFTKDGIKICVITTLPNDKILDMTKLETFADDILNIALMMISLFGRVENTVGKGEKDCHQNFLLLHSVFQSPLLKGR